MSLRYRMLFVMTGAQVFASVVQQGFGSLSPFIVKAFGVTKAELGLAFTALMLGGAVAGALSGLAVDRFGEKRTTSVCGIGIFLTLTFAASIPSYAGLVAALFCLGVVYAAISPAGGRAILGWFDRDRGFAMGIRQTGIPLGAVIGGLLLPLVAFHFGYRVALFGGGLLALAFTGGFPLFYREPLQDVPPVRALSTYLSGLRAILADGRTIPYLGSCMVLNATQQLSNGFIALTAIVLGHTTIQIASFVFVTTQVGAVLGRLGWGWASDVIFRGDRTMPMAWLCAMGTFGALGFAITSPSNVPLLFAAAFVLGFSGIGWTGLFSAAFVEISGPRFAGSALGFGSTVNFAAGSIGPFAFGAFADAEGLRASWIAWAVVLALATIPALIAHRAFLAIRRAEGAVAAGG